MNEQFRVVLEEIVLELQVVLNKSNFQYDVAKNNKMYANGLLEYYKGQAEQAKKIYNFVTALYENAVVGDKNEQGDRIPESKG